MLAKPIDPKSLICGGFHHHGAKGELMNPKPLFRVGKKVDILVTVQTYTSADDLTSLLADLKSAGLPLPATALEREMKIGATIRLFDASKHAQWIVAPLTVSTHSITAELVA